MGRNQKLALGAVVGVVAVAVAGFLLLNVLGGGDGPEELTFSDAPTTTVATGETAETSAPAGDAPGSELDGPWTVVAGSQAGYRVLEDRRGGVQNIEAVGRTNQVEGGFTVDGTTVTDVRAEVDVASITSDSSLRDGRFAGSIMDTAQFPTATFEADTVDLGTVPATGTTAKVTVPGTLTLKGQSRPVTVELEVRRGAAEIEILGSIPVVFADYGIETPQPPGLKVRDEGTVEFLLVAVPAA